MRLKQIGMSALSIIFLLIIIFISQYHIGTLERDRVCDKSITYSIGTFDRRFHISYQDLVSALAKAEAIWEKPLGKELFVYAPEDSQLKINLIYDYRQEATQTLSSLEGFLEENEATHDLLKVKYLGLKQEYDHLKKNYDAQVVFINKDSVTYEKQVEAWNMGDRNSREQFKELNLKKSNLEEGVEALKLLESQLNVMVRDINTVAGRLNSLARTLNLKVETYNTVGVSRGETYTGGLYQNTSSAEIINIYEFSNSDKLVKVLTHELGHALGFEHVSDPQAMMYYLNEGEASHLSESDLTILHTLCGVK